MPSPPAAAPPAGRATSPGFQPSSMSAWRSVRSSSMRFVRPSSKKVNARPASSSSPVRSLKKASGLKTRSSGSKPERRKASAVRGEEGRMLAPAARGSWQRSATSTMDTPLPEACTGWGVSGAVARQGARCAHDAKGGGLHMRGKAAPNLRCCTQSCCAINYTLVFLRESYVWHA